MMRNRILPATGTANLTGGGGKSESELGGLRLLMLLSGSAPSVQHELALVDHNRCWS